MLALRRSEKFADGGIAAACALAAACVAILCSGQTLGLTLGEGLALNLALHLALFLRLCGLLPKGLALVVVLPKGLALVKRGVCMACSALMQTVEGAVALPHVGSGAAHV